MINQEVLDTVLVFSLAILAATSVIYLVFFIPVLIQLSKTLKALYSLIAVFENYAISLQNSVDSAKKSALKLVSYVGEVFGSVAESVTDIFFKKK